MKLLYAFKPTDSKTDIQTVSQTNSWQYTWSSVEFNTKPVKLTKFDGPKGTRS